MKRVGTVVFASLVALAGSSLIRGNSGTDGEVPSIMISPSVLVLGSYGKCVSIHSNIAYRSVIDPGTLTLRNDAGDEILVRGTFSDDIGDLVAKFDRKEVESIVEVGTRIDLTLTGLMWIDENEDGLLNEEEIFSFEATDAIKVIDPPKKRPLSSRG